MPRLIVHGFTISFVVYGAGLERLMQLRRFVNSNCSALLAIVLLCASCTTTIGPEDYRIVNGLWVSSITGEPLSGKYELVRPPQGGQFGDKEHVESLEYASGVPVGRWTYSFGGDLIQSGEYLTAPAIKDSITVLTRSDRVDLEVFREGSWASLDVHLIKPMRIDSLTLRSVLYLVNKELAPSNGCSSVGVYAMQDSLFTQLYPVESAQDKSKVQ
jgi:hypothetical protein